jgi:hypothetical protein
MINLHGGTVISTATSIPMALATVFTLRSSGNMYLVSFFFILTLFSFLLSISTLIRFSINYKKYGQLLRQPRIVQ